LLFFLQKIKIFLKILLICPFFLFLIPVFLLTLKLKKMKTKNTFLTATIVSCLLIFSACEQPKSNEQPPAASPTEANKQLIMDWFDAFNKRDMEKLKTFFTDNYDYHSTEGIEGPDGALAFMEGFIKAFDAKLKLEDIVAEGDRVTYRLNGTGKHIGEYEGIPATNKDINIFSIGIARIENGKIAEEWEIFEELKLLQQLGVTPSPAQ
jgi:steroid delta-isomerase-like uncharacterized protein